MALKCQALTEMSTRYLPQIKERPALQANNFTSTCGPIVCKMWGPQRLIILWTYMASHRDEPSFINWIIPQINHDRFLPYPFRLIIQKQLYYIRYIDIIILSLSLSLPMV
jgi:hypothetical protein